MAPVSEAYVKLRERRWAEQEILFEGHPLTYDIYDYVLALQGNRCGICRRFFFPPYKPLPSADHDHNTREFRGVLCGGHNCNQKLLAAFEKKGSLKNAHAERLCAEYLKDPPAERAKRLMALPK